MIQLQRPYTTEKQSYELLELGIPADSADVYSNGKYVRFIPQAKTYSSLCAEKKHLSLCPRWTYGRLHEIFLRCSQSTALTDDYTIEFEIGVGEMFDMLEWIINTIHALIDLEGFDLNRLEEEV